jgi:hypothetical protein
MHAHTDSDTPDSPRRRFAFARKAPRTRSVLAATALLAVGVSGVGIAATGNPLREGKRNGTTTRETQIIGNLGSSTGLTGGYVTRQSNLSSSGGGAVYGCRSQAGGSVATPTPQNPCIRANNLSKGLAFEFQSSNGDTVGTINTGVGGDTKKPFTTNATGVATGLNADRVDNLDAAQIVAATRDPFAQIKADGTAGETLGVPTGGVTDPSGVGTWQVVFTGDLSKCALAATITGALAGQVAVDPSVAAGNTTVEVHTFDGTGAPANRGVHLIANC